jgi:hypothetical protein
MAELRGTSPRNLVIDSLIVVLIGIMLAILGPFGTFEQPFAIRLIYWVGLLVAGQLVYMANARLLIAAATRWDLPDALVWLGAAIFGSVPMTALVAIVNRAAFGMYPRTADQWLSFYFLVLIISFIITGVMWLVSTRRNAMEPSGRLAPVTVEPAPQPVAAEPAPQPSATGPRLLERVSQAKRGILYALESEDHYVRVHMDTGSELVLIRLRDAILETDGLEGLQVHRSWWVARQGVAEPVQDGRSIVLNLKTGTQAPVARASVADLEAKGWLS